MDTLELHLSKTTTPLYYLLLESMGLTSLELDHIASHVSLCIGIVTTLRGIPIRVQKNDLPLPIDICAKHNLIQEEVFRHGPEAKGFKDVVLDVATRANDHLSTSRQYIEDTRSKNPSLLNAAFCAFLPVVLSIDRFTNTRFRQKSIFYGWRKLISILSFVNRRIGNCRIVCGKRNGQRNSKESQKLCIDRTQVIH
jgi:NADH dehydrogenase [ubiquinone] 1 alpha subcomplex assembly factor 6